MLTGINSVGDRTSHGGTVLTGDATSTVAGKSMASDGDLTVCLPDMPSSNHEHGVVAAGDRAC
ncbi:PAAR domain-containing protein [Cupriavidus cauae]|uniref:PAAR domain-containing protein n=1 Tax=Cupriavidus TaxID=106589 RepID=UPI001CF3C32A|nr:MULTISPECIES: PAAR domain-containing protein [Cupriavidus]MCA7084716.1 PAAR domain-containing protein [Cupriavidus sp. DB3]UZN49627.1 PAAR domain-containing protein [Cupriavidus cauae]